MNTNVIQTPITRLLGIKHPILLAGMNQAAGPALAAAVTNAGGLGSIGGVGYTPEMLRKQLEELKADLVDKNAPFGVDLLLPKVGEGARKTNYDYTEGKLDELIDIIIESKAKLFISAVGVPPKRVVDRLHSAGILCMNMIGSPKHVKKALAVGIDLICAQGGEGGGHTGDVAFSVLIPAVVDLCKGHTSPLTGEPVYVVAAGGIYDGRGLAAALSYGAQAVWVGTRFVCATEAGATERHQQAIVEAGYHDTVRTIIYTGRPMRVLKNEYISDWEENRLVELKELTGKGIIPAMNDFEKSENPEDFIKYSPLLMGQIAGSIQDVKPAKEIVEEMVRDAILTIQSSSRCILPSKL